MLKGKIAVVTGGTRGIGYAIVKKYLENGAKVILFGSRQETVDKALASLKEENPEWEVSGACPSLTDAKEVADEIQAIHRKYGKIDILVNNAGVSDSMMTIDCNPEHFQEIINLNVNAVFNAIQPSVELMKEQGGGCIINTSSMVSKYGQPGGVAYPTSKFGVNGLTISLARELGQYGIRVNAVAPGIPEQIWWQHSRRKKFSRLLQRFLSEESENRKMWQMHASFSQVNLQVMCQEKF